MALPAPFRWTALGALTLAAACNDPPTAPLPAHLVVTRPTTTVGAPGFPLMDTIWVRVVDAEGNPRVGVVVNWVVRAGGGSVLPLSAASGTDGTTAAIWTLGPRPGYNELRASLGEESFETFTATGEVFRASEVVGDFYLGCGLVKGAIWCWGRYAPVTGAPSSNYDSASLGGQQYFDNSGPALYDDAREYTDVALGGEKRICALDTQGSTWCAPPYSSLPPAQVAGLPSLRRGSLTGSDGGGTCGLAEADGRAWCWHNGPPAVVPGSPAFSVLRMEFYGRLFCGLQTDSTAACWGQEPPGNGSSVPSAVPVTVSGGHRFVDLAVGSYFACGRTAVGELWCWGSNSFGGVRWREPVLSASGVTLVGATDEWLMVKQLGGQFIRGLGPDFGPRWWVSPNELGGLENVAVAGFADHGIGCVLGVEDEVYCVREMWNGYSGQDLNGYFPVMPVRQDAPVPAVLR